MKCPFRKETFIENMNFMSSTGFPRAQKIVETFSDCLEKECAMWNRCEEICGLPIIPAVPKVFDDYDPEVEGFSLM